MTSTMAADVNAGWTVPAIPSPVPVREQLVALMFFSAVAPLPIRVVLPGGRRYGRGGPASPVMRIERPSSFFRRMAVDGPVAVGESYMAGEWTCTDIGGLLTPFAARLRRPVSRPLAAFRSRADLRQPAGDRNTITGAQSNIHRHYDLSNELFAAFLDESMTYSAALWEDGDDLHAAQLRKIDTVLDLAGIGPGTLMLEIGTGWGSLAVRAARRGADVTTLTISREQRDAASRRAQAAGVSDRVAVRLCDYRQATGSFDAVVSVEMIEAVGIEYWPEYYATLDRLTAAGGKVVLQAITMPHDRMLATANVFTWIRKYIFPGGQIPSIRSIECGLEQSALRITNRRSFGEDYARTLYEWRTRFTSQREIVTALGFNIEFQRMWEYYLGYAEAGFRSGFLNVWHLQLRKYGPGSLIRTSPV